MEDRIRMTDRGRHYEGVKAWVHALHMSSLGIRLDDSVEHGHWSSFKLNADLTFVSSIELQWIIWEDIV